TGALHDAHDALELVADVGIATVYFAQEERLRFSRVAAFGEGISRADRSAVHHLKAGRNDPRGDDVAHDAGAGADVVKCAQHKLDSLGPRQEFYRHLDDDSQHALGTG